MRTPGGFERDLIRKAAARCNRDGITPAHSAAAASLEHSDRDEDGVEYEHDADDGPDAAKAFRDAYAPPTEYPQPIAVHPEDFRNGPVREGHGALSPGHEPPLQFPAPPRWQPPLPDLAFPGGECA